MSKKLHTTPKKLGLLACLRDGTINTMNTTRKGDLTTYVSLKAGRDVTHEEIATILELSRGTYANWRKNDKITASDVIKVARHYPDTINEVEALVDLGYADREAVIEYTEDQMRGFSAVATRKTTRRRRSQTDVIELPTNYSV